ncbi:TIGR03085 family metal-binding protein [Oerskovia turbata]
MQHTAWHAHERTALVHALALAGPDAPTLCEGWRTRHLAAHMVLREHRPWTQVGAVGGPLRDWSEASLETLAATALEPGGYAELLARVEAAPAAWSPWSWAGDVINLVEHFVHTEDVRRGAWTAGPGKEDRARALPPGLEDALWAQLRRAAPLFYRKAPTGVVLVVPGGRRLAAKAPADRPTDTGRLPGTVVVTGPVGELVLHAFGRGAHAGVTVEADAADRAALDAVSPGPR